MVYAIIPDPSTGGSGHARLTHSCMNAKVDNLGNYPLAALEKKLGGVNHGLVDGGASYLTAMTGTSPSDWGCVLQECAPICQCCG